MTGKKRNILVWLAIFLVIGIVLTGPWFYMADAITARVIDADTKRPLEGVIVTANWQLIYSTPGGAVPAGQLMVMESVSDNQGNIHFPAWGPRIALLGRLGHRRPQLLLFKPGYRAIGLQNTAGPRITRKSTVRSEWDGKTIELKKFEGSFEEYAEHIYSLGSDMDSVLDFARGDKACNWKKTPQMLANLHRMSLQLDKKGVKLKGWRLGQRILRVQDIPHNPDCGSPKEFLRSYLP